MKKIIIIIGLFLLSGCQQSENINNDSQIGKSELINSLHDIYLVSVKDCQYVLCERAYGSDMEHYADCSNKNHKQNKLEE